MTHFADNSPFQKSFKVVAIFANCFGLFPIAGVTSNFASDLKFQWFSLKMLYSLLLLFLGFFRLVAIILYLFQKYSFPAMSEWKKNENISHIYWFLVGKAIYCINWILITGTHIYLARHWARVMSAWCKVDATLENKYGYPKTLDKRIKVIIAAAILVSLSKTCLQL